MGEPVPRRLDPTERERLGVIVTRMPGGSDQGQTRFAHPIQEPDIGPHRITSIAVVVHGDDPLQPRPTTEIVMWVGASFPANAAEYDFYYPANID